jgi:NitT/TauT family transport system substrate-binding protein
LTTHNVVSNKYFKSKGRLTINKKALAGIFLGIIVIVAGVLFFMNNGDDSEQTIRIARISGTTGVPIHIMYELNLIEKYAPNVNIELTTFESATAINEGFIAGIVDIGALGVTNVLMGIDRGIPYRISSGLTTTSFGLRTNDLSVQSLADIRPDHVIALPTLTGNAAILFYMASEQYLGDPMAFKNQLVAMSNSNAELALMNRAGIDLHFAGLATTIRQNEAGFPTILRSHEIIGGDYSQTLSVTTNAFYEQHPDLYEAFILALQDAIDLINSRDIRVIEIIAKEENIPEALILEYLDTGALVYSMDIYNIKLVADFAYDLGEISNRLESLQDVSFPNVTER